MKWFKWLFFPNWKVVYHDQGSWIIDVESNIDFLHYTKKEWCNYYIYYSDVRNKYKIVCKGYKPKNHHLYNNEIVTLKQIDEIISYLNQ